MRSYRAYFTVRFFDIFKKHGYSIEINIEGGREGKYFYRRDKPAVDGQYNLYCFSLLGRVRIALYT